MHYTVSDMLMRVNQASSGVQKTIRQVADRTACLQLGTAGLRLLALKTPRISFGNLNISEHVWQTVHCLMHCC